MSTLVERNKTWQKPANTIIKTDIYCKLAYKLLLLSIEINKHLNISSALDDIKVLLHTVNLPSHPIFVQNVSSLTVHRHAGLHTWGFSLTTRWCSKIGLFTFALTHNYLLNRHFNPCLYFNPNKNAVITISFPNPTLTQSFNSLYTASAFTFLLLQK